MTREEAIKYFKRHLDLYCVDGISREAEEMAIQALSQEPCDDVVSREAVYGILMRGDFRDTCGYECFKTRLEQLPSVTQKPNFCASCKHYADNEICLECEYDGITRGMTRYESVTQKSGKWEFHCQHWSKCSICGYADKFADKWNYCPNCGAKMENVEKSLIDINAESGDKE